MTTTFHDSIAMIPQVSGFTTTTTTEQAKQVAEELRGDANRGFNIDKDAYFKAFRDAESAHGIKEQP